MVVPLIYKRSGEDDDPMNPFNVPDVSKGVANQYNSAASQNLSGKGFGKNPGELYDWNDRSKRMGREALRCTSPR